MSAQNYFSWLSSQTPSLWTNDSGVMEQNLAAVKMGAIGCTTNPPLSYEALVTDKDFYAKDLAAIDRNLSDDDFALEAMGLVVKRLAKHYLPLHKEKGGLYGCVRAQVQPNLQNDPEGMLRVGKIMASWGENVFVKIPATEAGIWTIEELAALGIHVNPTVVTTISQMSAFAEAYERGAARAKNAGLKVPMCTEAFVMGRAQDYLVQLNTHRGAGISTSDLEWASVALVKRSWEIYKQKGYSCTLQPAAFRCAMHVEQISGGPFCSTIHPKIQAAVVEADKAGKMRYEQLIDSPADKAAVDRVLKAFPEFALAYEPDALKPSEFGSEGASKMTLDFFDENGWKKLISLR